MSGIPVYTQSPINAARASGITQQTTTPQGQNSSSNPIPAATTTSASSSSSTYSPAQPGVASLLGPTTAPQLPPLHPTPTTRETTDSPPQPQPGGLPTPASRRTIPPSPKAGELYRPQETGVPPYRMEIPPLAEQGVQPPRSSSTTTSATVSYPVAIPSAEFGIPRRSLEHPPNYQQNVYASELTSDQRRAHEANTSGTGTQDTPESVGGIEFLNTATRWAQQAGKKISEAEAEVWRRINKG